MSDLATYKATFNTTNKYLRYFCNKPASDWTLKKYKKYFSDKDPEKIKKVFVENLQTIKNDSKNISSIVNQHINALLESVNSASSKSTSSTNFASSTPSSSTVNNITVKGNYYNAGRDITINETVERDIKKQKNHHEDKKEIEEVDFKQKWG